MAVHKCKNALASLQVVLRMGTNSSICSLWQPKGIRYSGVFRHVRRDTGFRRHPCQLCSSAAPRTYASVRLVAW
jgi:hypothetical protein